jgi:hypothetical protein
VSESSDPHVDLDAIEARESFAPGEVRALTAEVRRLRALLGALVAWMPQDHTYMGDTMCAYCQADSVYDSTQGRMVAAHNQGCEWLAAYSHLRQP